MNSSRLLQSLLAGAALAMPCLAPAVEFRVPAAVLPESTENVAVAGEFNAWSPTANPMRRDGADWVATVDVPDGDFLYKIVMGRNAWHASPVALGYQLGEHGLDSTLTVKEGKIVSPSDALRKTMVRVTQESASAEPPHVLVISHRMPELPIRMTKAADGMWEAWLPASGTYSWNIVKDGALTVPNWRGPDLRDATAATVAGGGAPTEFRLAAAALPEAPLAIFVGGTMNQWKSYTSAMTKKDGDFVATISVPDGEHAYRFAAFGKDMRPRVILDPTNPDMGPDGFDGINNLGRFEGGKRLPMEGMTAFSFTAPEAKSVCLTGDFVNWQPAVLPLLRGADGKWTGNLRIGVPTAKYQFVVDGERVPDPSPQVKVENDPQRGPVSVFQQASTLRGDREIERLASQQFGLSTSLNADRVQIEPAQAVRGKELTIIYDTKRGPLAGQKDVYLYWGINLFMSTASEYGKDPKDGVYRWTITVPLDAKEVNVVFNNGAGVWDNNGEKDWTFVTKE